MLWKVHPHVLTGGNRLSQDYKGKSSRYSLQILPFLSKCLWCFCQIYVGHRNVHLPFIFEREEQEKATPEQKTLLKLSERMINKGKLRCILECFLFLAP